MSQTPRVDFSVLRNQIRMYDSSEPSVEYELTKPSERSERVTRYNLELELTSLDFLRDELKEIAKDVESRSRAVAELLDQRI